MNGQIAVSNAAPMRHGLDEPPDEDRRARPEREQGGDETAHEFDLLIPVPRRQRAASHVRGRVRTPVARRAGYSIVDGVR